jgi:hypothetical protein
MSNPRPPSSRPPGVEYPADEVVWVSCRASKSCEGKKAKVLLRKNDGINGTWIQYICMTCRRPFSVRF